MPVRSSLCTYSPAASKYSTGSANSNSLSYGHYKPLTSSYKSPSSYNSPTTSSDPPASSRSLSSRYSSLSLSSPSSSSSSSSPSSYSPASSTYNFSSSSSAGQYKPLGSSSSSRYGNNLTVTSSPTSKYSSNQDYLLKSVSPSCSLSSSAYSSGSSTLSSSGSSTSSSSSLLAHHHYTSPSTYVPKSRRLSQTSNYSSNSSLRSISSPSSRVATNELAECSPPLPAGVPRGLINLGNTCYMNASLQSLYSIEPFRRLVGSIGRSCDTDKVLTNELAELFKLMMKSSSSSSSGGATSPANFKYAFSHYQPKFSGFGQQDAQEFLRYLVNGIHEESNAARRRTRVARATSTSMSGGPRTSQEAWSQYRQIVDDSPLVDLLVGQLCSTITCTQCQHQSHCWDPFWDLSLPLATTSSSLSGRHTGSGGVYSSSASSSCSSLREILDEFMAKETLDSDERPICSRCQRATRSTKQISLARLPEVLILHLKKFTNDGYKLSSSDIQIDKQLTFNCDNNNNNSNNYQLKAIISHHGHSACSGHYTCHADYQSRWFHFNDDRVHDVSSSFMCSQSNNNKLDDAYVLFYTRASATTRRPSISQKSKL